MAHTPQQPILKPHTLLGQPVLKVPSQPLQLLQLVQLVLPLDALRKQGYLERLHTRIWSVQVRVRARIWSVRARIWSVRARIWSVRACIWSVRARIWSVRARIWSVRACIWSVRTCIGALVAKSTQTPVQLWAIPAVWEPRVPMPIALIQKVVRTQWVVERPTSRRARRCAPSCLLGAAAGRTRTRHICLISQMSGIAAAPTIERGTGRQQAPDDGAQ